MYWKSWFFLAPCLCFTFARNFEHERKRRDTVAEESRKWPGGIVPYVFGYTSGYDVQKVFNEAKKQIEKVSCVRFVKRTSEYNYVRIISSRDGCYSIIGRDGGRQDLSLGNGCLSTGIAIHELMHTLGFYHEHTRRDRDRHVFVDVANTMEGAKRQFEKYKPGEAETHGQPYDPDSIMHYSNKAFSKNGQRTIIYRKNPSKKLGQRMQMSPTDIKQLNSLYRCEKKQNKKNGTNNQPKTKQIEIDNCRDNPWAGIECLLNYYAGGCFFSSQKIKQLCSRTCGFCRPTCFDTSSNCRRFAEYGYCNYNANVREKCRKSCKLCRIE